MAILDELRDLTADNLHREWREAIEECFPGMSASDLITEAIEYVVEAARNGGISAKAAVTIYLYTKQPEKGAIGVKRTINKFLRRQGGSVMGAFAKPLEEALNSAMIQLSPVNGRWFRFETISEELLMDLESEGKFVDSGYLSAYGNPVVEAGRDLFVIDGWSARSIAEFSQAPGERELLFAPGTRFGVASTAIEAGRHIVHLVELDT